MPVIDFPDLKPLLVRDGRLMGLDVGSKTIGIATSDVLRTLATPLTTLKRAKLAADLATLDQLVTRYEVKALVVGLPLCVALMRRLAPAAAGSNASASAASPACAVGDVMANPRCRGTPVPGCRQRLRGVPSEESGRRRAASCSCAVPRTSARPSRTTRATSTRTTAGRPST